jgi:L-cysteine S-thiosulfotransferase
MRERWSLALFLASCACLACGAGRKGSSGFRLPDGDPERGRMVFVANRCHDCHTVAGENFPAPVAEPAVPVQLGGEVPVAITDGDLMTSVVYPSHRRAARAEPAALVSGKLSRMGDFSEAMTVRDLIDLVAYLQSRYRVMPPTPYYK